MDYSHLQNGSDIRGVALAGVENEPVTLSDDAVSSIAGGFFAWLQKKRPDVSRLRIAIGRDSRLSGEHLLQIFATALSALGCDVTDFGLCTTPAMFMTTVTPGYEFDASVMVTASHLPWNRNGLKFFTANGGLEKADIAEILSFSAQVSPVPQAQGTIIKDNFLPTYAAQLRNLVISASGREQPLKGYRIVVDAGNGAGGFYATQVLQALGADISGSVLLDPDGHFPCHVPNPELPAAMDYIRDAVMRSHADLGIIFDTDVDRAGAVLTDGTELNRNRLIAAISAILLREHPGTTIVTDSITSDGLAHFIEARGGVHRRFKRGYRNVINESLRLNAAGQDSQLAIETSGHAALKENYFLDDGAYLVTKLLLELAGGRSLASLISDLSEPTEGRECRLPLEKNNFRTIGEQILSNLEQYAATREGWNNVPDNCEGVRINLDKKHGNGWFLLRLSLHDPILPLNIESEDKGGVEVILSELRPFFAEQTGVDCTPLN